MAKESIKARERKRAKMVAKYAAKRAALKEIVRTGEPEDVEKAVATKSRKDISNFKLRRGMPIGVRVTLRGERMYEFLERLVTASIPRIRDFRGINDKGFDGKGNYTFGIAEQIIFPEIDIDKIDRIQGMDITFVTSAQTDKEAMSLLKEFGLPFKNQQK